MFKRMICCLLTVMLLTAAGCTAETGTETMYEGEISMTEFQIRALTAIGVNPEEFNIETARPAEKRMFETVVYAESFLTGKYPDTEFIVESYVQAELMQTYDELQLTAVGEKPVSFTLQIEEEDGILTGRDNYYGKLKVAEYEAMIAEEIRRAVDTEVDVYASIICMLGADFNSAMPVAEAAVKSEFFSYTWILVSPECSDFAAVMESVKAMIEEKGFGGEFTLFRMIEALPDGITKEEADALILSHRSSAPVYQERVTFTVFAD